MVSKLNESRLLGHPELLNDDFVLIRPDRMVPRTNSKVARFDRMFGYQIGY